MKLFVMPPIKNHAYLFLYYRAFIEEYTDIIYIIFMTMILY